MDLLSGTPLLSVGLILCLCLCYPVFSLFRSFCLLLVSPSSWTHFALASHLHSCMFFYPISTAYHCSVVCFWSHILRNKVWPSLSFYAGPWQRLHPWIGHAWVGRSPPGLWVAVGVESQSIKCVSLWAWLPRGGLGGGSLHTGRLVQSLLFPTY